MTARPDSDCGCSRTVSGEGGVQTALVHKLPAALTHFYPLPALGSAVIPLYRGQFDGDGKRYRGTVSLVLDPRPAIEATGVKNVTLDELLALDGSRGSAEWVARPTVEVHASAVPAPPKSARIYSRGKPGTQRVSLDPSPIEVGTPTVVDEITFFVINGWRASDGLNTCYGGTDRPGRLQVQLDDWELRIEPRADVSTLAIRDHMRATGQSTVTHVGRLRRTDLTDFNPSDGLQAIDTVESLVSFALGRVTSILLPVGWHEGVAVWAQWSALRAVDRPLGAAPWLDGNVMTAQLAELIRRGHSARQDPLRWEVFERALGYYFSSSFEATVTTKVMLPISALQMLSFAHFVEVLPTTDPNHLSKKAWEALSTDEVVRRLLNELKADFSVPSHLSHLSSVQATIAATAHATPDGLRCIVKMRNDVAHPSRTRLARWNTYQWAEAGFLTMELFDLALLWWLGYKGRYMPRTAQHRSHDDSIDVPWVPAFP